MATYPFNLQDAENNILLPRRQFFKKAIAGFLVAASGTGIYSTFVEPRWLDIRHVKIPLRNLPSSFEGFTILHLSDIHHGKFVTENYITACLQKVSHIKPDLIALTGDYVTAHAKYAYPCMEMLKTMNARHGIFSVAGNHDYWTDIGAVTRAIKKSGIPLFVNEHTVLRKNGEKIYIGGLDDLWAGKPDFEKTFRGTKPEDVKILMMHNPDLFSRAEDSHIDLVMSGHTHGGQVSLPIIGPPIVPSKYGKRYASGLFKKGRCWMYVNRGIGVISPPVRFRVRPEITVYTLTRAG